jgi:ADP-dependent NAD(P)H-hydrate dehydratase
MPANASPEPEVGREAVEADPLDAALAAANLLHAVVVMKGAQTWIAP